MLPGIMPPGLVGMPARMAEDELRALDRRWLATGSVDDEVRLLGAPRQRPNDQPKTQTST
jgi:hypothetical protein